ncbi:hypothetical protein F5148DRAFT_1189627 [Russula earlei]|uniref:Uncharacterized protein n=1 Tax=Russula earlei TaxID=71964 RepID=A0ACC0UBS2_9AGAM|nr:hypothetical protein F5148DRAFT_1189627 [Russula earlei]
MSAPSQEVLTSLLLRSSTPAIWKYFPKQQSSARSGLEDEFGTHINGDGQEDMASDVQEGAQSTVGSLIQRNGVHVEPGPDDEPGPHYESYGSSFGNFGPMPPESAFGDPTHAAGVPLPTSVASPSVKARTSRTGSRASASQKAPSMVSRTQKEPTSALEKTAMKSRVNEKQSTLYPPLPPSQSQSNIGSASAVKYRTYSRAPSLSPHNGNAVRSVGKEPSLPPVPPSDGDSQAEGDPRLGYSPQSGDAHSRAAGPSILSNGNNRSQRPFSPYRNGPTEQDLLHAVLQGLASVTPSPANGSPSKQSHELDEEETRLVENVLNQGNRTPRTSHAATSVLEPNQFSHYHDMNLCILLHQLDDPDQHEVVKKAVRKAVKARVKQLGMKYDNETIKQYRKSFHDHDPSVHLRPDYQPPLSPEEPPEWAKELQRGVFLLTQRVDSLGPKIDSIKVQQQQAMSPVDERKYYMHEEAPSEFYTQTPLTQTVNIQTHPTGTVGDESMFQPATDIHIVESTHGQTLPGSMHHHDGSTHGLTEQEEYEDDETEHGRGAYPQTSTQGDTQNRGLSEYTVNRDSPGQQYLEEELYKLRVRTGPGSQSGNTHKTWELARDNGDYEEDPDGPAAVTESGMQEVPDSNPSGYGDRRASSPPLPPLPSDDGARDVPAGQVWQQQPASDYNSEPPQLLPWQRIHQRLLNWAIVWPVSELDTALNSTTRGNQVDEVALSIWSTQTYKRYVRSKMTDGPGGRVDRLFVPPNMADAISNAVFNGRHGDASGMLRELWHPFGLEGMPRLLVVLAKHRSDNNHWVVHRFSLPDGTLTTYDSYPERCLPDGRPLGWWFAIRIAWPNAIYPSPDHLMQKMVRLHRPMQLGIDNSVAAAGIWRNLLMGSRAERSLDLERLRDLINTEVKNLRQRKLMGKLSIGAPRPNWDDM